MRAPTLSGLIIGFLVLFALFRALELRRPSELRTPILRPGLATDIAYWIFTPFAAHYVVGFAVLLAVAVIAVVIYGTLDKNLILGGFGPLARLPYALQALLMLVIADVSGYWMHRLFHGRRLWRFHAVHHSSAALDWLSATRVHPVNELLQRLMTILPLLGLGFAPAAAAGVAPVLALFAILLHANLDWDWGPLRSVIASPRFHRWHHSSETEAQDKNFAGLFPVWDILFGTYYMPQDRLPRHFGTQTPVPPGLLGQLAFPFQRTSP
jgi:sterol desaturase/sphingolipid hydroxylase (fatty acid hydroxylase superfamily)